MKIVLHALLVAGFLAGFLAGSPLRAQTAGADGKQEPAKSCGVSPDLLPVGGGVLGAVAAAIKTRRKLDILVVGSGSSTLAGAEGASIAYPARLEASLREKLPGVAVAVSTDLQPKKPADEVAETLKGLVAERKPDLLLWQTGTVDAIRSVHPDDFRNALDEGVGSVRAAGADAMLMNLQYSPQMEAMIATGPYLDAIRAVAQQQDVPLFDRYAVMLSWSEHDVFDLSSSSRSFALAKAVHGCIGRALADFVITAAKVDPTEFKAQR